MRYITERNGAQIVRCFSLAASLEDLQTRIQMYSSGVIAGQANPEQKLTIKGYQELEGGVNPQPWVQIEVRLRSADFR